MSEGTSQNTGTANGVKLTAVLVACAVALAVGLGVGFGIAKGTSPAADTQATDATAASEPDTRVGMRASCQRTIRQPCPRTDVGHRRFRVPSSRPPQPCGSSRTPDVPSQLTVALRQARRNSHR